MNVARSSGWYPAPSSLSPRARGWLENRGSLTQLIQQRCRGDFQVKPVFQSLAAACRDELALMSLRRKELALGARGLFILRQYARGICPFGGSEKRLARRMARVEWTGQPVAGYRIIYQSRGQTYTAPVQEIDSSASAF